MAETVNKKSIVKELIDKGKQKGMLTEQEIEDALSELELDADQIEKIHDNFEALGIDIVGDIEQEIKKIEISEEDLEDLSVPEGINVDDHVRMYLKEIGKVPLLSADEEIEFARLMSEGDEEAKKKAYRGKPQTCCKYCKALCGQRYAFP